MLAATALSGTGDGATAAKETGEKAERARRGAYPAPASVSTATPVPKRAAAAAAARAAAEAAPPPPLLSPTSCSPLPPPAAVAGPGLSDTRASRTSLLRRSVGEMQGACSAGTVGAAKGLSPLRREL